MVNIISAMLWTSKFNHLVSTHNNFMKSWAFAILINTLILCSSKCFSEFKSVCVSRFQFQYHKWVRHLSGIIHIPLSKSIKQLWVQDYIHYTFNHLLKGNRPHLLLLRMEIRHSFQRLSILTFSFLVFFPLPGWTLWAAASVSQNDILTQPLLISWET